GAPRGRAPRSRSLTDPERGRSSRPRSALLPRHLEAARTRLGAAARVGRRDPLDDRLVPREPRLVGADQALRRLPRVLRAAVRRKARLTVLLRLPAQAVNRILASLDRLGLVQESKDAVAVAELVARVCEVVLRVRLVQLAGAVELLHRLLEERQRT